MRDALLLDNDDVNSFLHAVAFMSDVALGETTYVEYFTDEDLKGFKIMCKFLFPLVQRIHEERTRMHESNN